MIFLFILTSLTFTCHVFKEFNSHLDIVFWNLCFENKSYFLILLSSSSFEATEIFARVLLNLLIFHLQFPKGDVPEWVCNAMEVAGIDISSCCAPFSSCQEDDSNNVSEEFDKVKMKLRRQTDMEVSKLHWRHTQISLDYDFSRHKFCILLMPLQWKLWKVNGILLVLFSSAYLWHSSRD